MFINLLYKLFYNVKIYPNPLNFEDFVTISGLKIWFPWVHFVAALPELFFSCGLLVILVYVSLKEFKLTLIKVYNLIILLLFFTILIQLLNPYSSPFFFDLFNVFLKLDFLFEWQAYFLFRRNFIVDYYSIVIKIVILLFSIFFLHLFKYYVRFSVLMEYPILICFLIFGLILLVQSFDLITMYLSLELIALTSYILVAFARNSIESLEAGIKYLILGSVASGFILFGSALLYGVTSYTDFYNLKMYIYYASESSLDPCGLLFNDGAKLLTYNIFFEYATGALKSDLNLGIFLGSLFINFGFLFKLSAAPFHMWAPDVYEGSPLFTTALFLTIVKIAIFTFYLRLVYFLFYDLFMYYIQFLLVFCGLLSIFWGSFAGLGQVRIKRLFAYSGIVNTGFVLLGLSEGTLLYSTYSVFLYLCLYFLVTVGIFFFFLITRNVFNGESMDFYTDLRGFGKMHPFLGFSFSLLLLSLAGVPPLVGFWGKLGIFISLLNTGYSGFVVVVILASVVSSFYYLRLIRIMFFDSTIYLNSFKTFFASWYILFVYYIIIFFILLFFLTPSFLNYVLYFDLLEYTLLFKYIF